MHHVHRLRLQHQFQKSHDDDDEVQNEIEDDDDEISLEDDDDDISKVLQVENEIWPNDEPKNEFLQNETTWEFQYFQSLPVEVTVKWVQNGGFGGFGGFEKFIEEERDEISKSNS